MVKALWVLCFIAANNDLMLLSLGTVTEAMSKKKKIFDMVKLSLGYSPYFEYNGLFMSAKRFLGSNE